MINRNTIPLGQPRTNRVQQISGAIVIGVFTKSSHIGSQHVAHEIRERMLRLADGHVNDLATGCPMIQQATQTGPRRFR